ncbi:MAG: D-sedoheptulose 7-phosphate isomerase [Fidelibacterota bacterium]|nr:MAG: D-sedoheptulose 7-phosphate isomerase [Candidatus Neomarinimicrobiota bacterium]
MPVSSSTPKDARDIIAEHLNAGAATIQGMLAECLDDLLAAADRWITTLSQGNKLLFCGNGGSAADAQHLAAELMGRFMGERHPLPAIALTTDTSFLTAWSNDVAFELVFARQVEGLGRPGDTLVAISTSGNSPNVLRAVEQAQRQEMNIVSFTGQSGGQLGHLSRPDDVLIRIPSSDTQHVQEGHITAGHVLCALVENALRSGTA